MDAADLGQWQRTRRCVPREASRTLLPEAPRLPKTARTSGRAARDPAASCPPVSVRAPVLRKELVHAFPTPYTDETLSRRLRLTDSAPFRSREAGPRPGLRRHCGPARHGRRRHTALIHAGLPGGSRSARHRILRLCFARRASVRRRPVEVAASDEQQERRLRLLLLDASEQPSACRHAGGAQLPAVPSVSAGEQRAAAWDEGGAPTNSRFRALPSWEAD
jgi:hypothetical protein